MKILKNLLLLFPVLINYAISGEKILLENKNKSEIIIIYNAESGIFNSLSDYVHKIVSPETYQCSLCGLTYGNLGMEVKWKNYLQQLTLPVSFKYKNQRQEIPEKFVQTALPVILFKKNGTIKELLNSHEINAAVNLEELIRMMDNKISICS